MPAHASQSTVAIVLCTYNGARHLQEQLDSLAAQSWPVAVRVFDDASTDNTVELVSRYTSGETNKLDITITINAENIGYVANFESGINHVLKEGFDHIALSDQDDIWHPERIVKGMNALLTIEEQKGTQAAVLVHSDLRMIDSNKRCVHSSFFKYRHYEIAHKRSLPIVLGQNGVMGNTILMNRKLAAMSQPFPADLHVHDYWLAVLAELYGERVLLEQALVDYRIHDTNASNSSSDIKFGLNRWLNGKSWGGFVARDFRLPFKEDVRLNVVDKLLNDSSNLPTLNNEQRQLLTLFRNYLVFNGSRFTLLRSMLSAGFFRKGLAHRLRLAFTTLLTKRYD